MIKDSVYFITKIIEMFNIKYDNRVCYVGCNCEDDSHSNLIEFFIYGDTRYEIKIWFSTKKDIKFGLIHTVINGDLIDSTSDMQDKFAGIELWNDIVAEDLKRFTNLELLQKKI